MILKPFEYFSPRTLQEACQILNEREGAKVLAGGQSLIPIMKLNLAEELSCIVDIKRIPDLSSIQIEKDQSSENEELLSVGALATHSQVASSEAVQRLVPLLSITAASIGHPLVRNRGTIGGSLAHCDPAADLCASSLALDARMSIVGPANRRRTLPASDFFLGTFSTALKKEEILEKISYPIYPGKGTGYAFEKLTIGHGDFPLVVVSIILRVGDDGKCYDARIALGGVFDRAERVRNAENVLVGKTKVTSDDIEMASKIASDESRPESDLDVSKEYKKKMVRVFSRRALTKALERAVGVV